MRQLFIVVVSLFFVSIARGQTQMPASPTAVDYNQADIDRLWTNWQRNYIEMVTVNGQEVARVISDNNTLATFSEGQAYGMLFTSLMNDQATFDNLWAYAQYYFNNNGLMSWHIGQDGQPIDVGAATDADLDMAMALIYACRRAQLGDWFGTSDYCGAATDIIDAIWLYEIDKPGDEPSAGLPNNEGYELIPGDFWCLSCDYPNGITNPSYFSPAYFSIFAEFTSRAEWLRVNNRNYDLLEQAQSLDCSQLVPNWTTYNGQAQIVEWQGQASTYWGWDAARVSWRLALSRYWFDDVRAENTLNAIGGFFDGIGINNVRSEYRLDGQAVNSYTDTFFIAHAANAIWGMSAPTPSSCSGVSQPNNTTPQQAYNAVQQRSSDGYYNDSWQLLSMLLMTGYFNHPAEPFILPHANIVVATETSLPLTAIPTESPASTIPTPMNIPLTVASEIVGVSVEQAITVTNSQQAQFEIKIINDSSQALDNLSIRFYFQVDANLTPNDYVLAIHWDSTGVAILQAPTEYRGQIYYFAVSYSQVLDRESNWDLHGALHLRDWSNALDATNDWWIQGSLERATSTETPYLPLFIGNELIYGATP